MSAQELEQQLLELIRKMKVAMNSHEPEEYEILGVKLRNKMTEYFLADSEAGK